MPSPPRPLDAPGYRRPTIEARRQIISGLRRQLAVVPPFVFLAPVSCWVAWLHCSEGAEQPDRPQFC
ncbi:hypothetical protein PR202_gb00111 [Eleusine coracana subsp. coracana]|uniref:Uncharacterized protein n=1 Tax=Eleusine coracana subsp. coracana TaxID=191504 RepID=A0AAV5DT35_ELECO|nr:hypothetical protein PR202_gb00111 [Eleusine coracana subsp. coracana]